MGAVQQNLMRILEPLLALDDGSVPSQNSGGAAAPAADHGSEKEETERLSDEDDLEDEFDAAEEEKIQMAMQVYDQAYAPHDAGESDVFEPADTRRRTFSQYLSILFGNPQRDEASRDVATDFPWDWDCVDAAASWVVAHHDWPTTEDFLDLAERLFGCDCEELYDPSVDPYKHQVLEALLARWHRFPTCDEMHAACNHAVERRRLPTSAEHLEYSARSALLASDPDAYSSEHRVVVGMSAADIAALPVARVPEKVPAAAAAAEPTRMVLRSAALATKGSRKRKRGEAKNGQRHAKKSKAATDAPAADPAISCGLCLEPVAPGQDYYVLPPCNHTYHRTVDECLGVEGGTVAKWLASHKHCPQCRTPVATAAVAAPPNAAPPAST